MRPALWLACLISSAASASGPKLTGSYFPAPAAARILRGELSPADLSTALTFTRDQVKVEWPSETASYPWRATKGGVEVKPFERFVALTWKEGAGDEVNTDVLSAAGPKPESVALRWVPSTAAALWARRQQHLNASAFKRLAGTWTGGEKTLELTAGKAKWNGERVVLDAGDCRLQCGGETTVCLSAPGDKGLRFALVDGALRQATWESICSPVPGEAWGFAVDDAAAPLHRR